MLNESHSQFRSVNRHVDLLQNIGKRADMILMAVGDHKALYLVNILLQIRHIRNHQVDSQHIISRESKAAVYHDNGILILKGGNIHADLFQSA